MEKITVDKAREIVELEDRVRYLEFWVKSYDNGKSWDISTLGDSKHFNARSMINHLSKEDQTAINRYIVNKFKKTIKNGKQQLEDFV